MDCYSIDSEILGTLDYLRPPVKRDNVDTQRNYLGYVIGASDNENFVRDFTNNCNTGQKKYHQPQNQSVETSQSLILQKTCKKHIIEKYSSINGECRIRQKKAYQKNCCPTCVAPRSVEPIIKVTIVQKPDQRPLIKLLKKHKHITKTLQTAFVGENSYQTKGVYLVVAGNRNEKIYEVKTTASTTCKTLKDIGKVNNVKKTNEKPHTFRITKMEKKKKKPTKEAKIEEAGTPNVTCGCKLCVKDKNVGPYDGTYCVPYDEPYVGPSEVKIFGRFGLDGEDKYFLKCGATVNGQPVSSSSEEQRNLPCVCPSNTRVNNQNQLTHRNQCTQVNLSVKLVTSPKAMDRKIQCECYDCSNKTILHDNQYSDSAGEPDVKKLKALGVKLGASPKTTDRKIQCECYDRSDETILNDNQESESAGEPNKNLKASNSPLVIISVYPVQESAFALNKKQDSSCPTGIKIQNYRALPSNPNEDIKVNTFVIHTDRTRPLSPNRVNVEQTFHSSEASKNEDNKSNKSIATQSIRASRSASPASRSPKLNIHEEKTRTFKGTNGVKNNVTDDKHTLKETNDVKTKARDKSPYRLYSHDKRPQRDANSSKQSNNITMVNRTEKKNLRNVNLRSHLKPHDKSVNTDKAQNNIPVERFTKKVTNMKNKNIKKSTVIGNDVLMDKKPNIRKAFPKNEASKVSVSIDSDKEYYDVIFEKGRFTTDLTVRKTTKETGSQKYFEENIEDNFEKTFNDNYLEENHKSDSLENFFPIAMTGHHRRSVSQAFNTTIDGYPMLEHLSRLTVRDSLVICHRRDVKDINIQSSKRISEQNSGADNDVEFKAPVKHYTGDNCIIDPLERDKEIRDLLGIVKIKADIKQTDKKRHKIHTNHHLITTHNLFQGALCKSLLTSLMLGKACSCSFCTGRISMAAEPKTINCLRKDEDKNSIDQHKQVLKTITAKNNREHVKKEDVNQGIIVNTPITISQSINCEALESSNRNQSITKHKPIYLSRKQYIKVKKSIRKGQRQKRKQIWNSSIVSIGTTRAKTKSDYLIHWNREVQTDPLPMDNLNCKNTKRHETREPKYKKYCQNNTLDPKDNKSTPKNTVVLYCRDTNTVKLNNCTRNTEVRKIASSVEIRYSNIAYMKEMAYSFTNFESLGSSNLERKHHNSIETIFRCHGKTHTPNLGASALSLLSEDVRSVSKSESLPLESRPKKPFLRRLMSCLVMRSEKTSQKILQRKPQHPTMPSSFDSYQISTSLGAVGMGSSLYDTSASFYSNHTIGPVTNKTKRGFLSSVRGFLAARKS